MNKPKLYLILLAVLVIASCERDTKQKKDVTLSISENVEILPPPDYYLTSKETERHVVFPFDIELDANLFESNVRPANLSKDEIVDIEGIIAKQIAEYNKTAYKPVKQPEKYFKQLIPVVNSKGEKEVWVDCFCSVTPDWKKYREHVNDGGNCFLHFKINLTRGVVLKFFANGLA